MPTISLEARAACQSTYESSSLVATGVNCAYRHCDSCRNEWPAEHTHCPKCLRWLGDHPLQRIEWQVAPGERVCSPPVSYEFICAATLCLRIVGSRPTERELREIQIVLSQILPAERGSHVLGVARRGWLLWNSDGARRAFHVGDALRKRLASSLPAMARALSGQARLRWGIWVDSYVLPFSCDSTPIVSETTAAAIFDFEPDELLLVSEYVFEVNCRSEQFVCIPARRSSSTTGYRHLGHKRPSAVDHARVAELSRFVGRSRSIQRLDAAWRTSQEVTQRIAVVAAAGSGKTRLVNEWLRRHPDIRALRASYSIFGDDVASFAAQLAELPDEVLDIPALAAQAQSRIQREHIEVLIIDDLHWADERASEYLTQLFAKLSAHGMLILLCARPSGRQLVRKLEISAEIRLRPLATVDSCELAHSACPSPSVAAVAARLACGNPLFVEQFAAWSTETRYTAGTPCPQNLHQVIAARIRHLEMVRLKSVKAAASCSGFLRYDVHNELEEIESEIGLWLDRLETGDYADRVEVARYLTSLERIDFEIFIIGAIAGRPRSRSNRLKEAIERLFIGSANEILKDMEERARHRDADDLNLQHEAAKFGECAAGHYRWDLAARFYQLASVVASPPYKRQLRERLVGCARYLDITAGQETAMDYSHIREELEIHPAVDALRLPEVWLKLGQSFYSRRYFVRAAEAAHVVNNRVVADLARKKASSAQFP